MASLDTIMSFHRVNSQPLDDSMIFNTIDSMLNYVKNNGAAYNGQKVSVINNYGIVDYTVCDKIPIIDLKGTEPIFKSITFNNTAYASMLIYDSGFNNSSSAWTINELFKISAEKYSLFNQLKVICNGSYVFEIDISNTSGGVASSKIQFDQGFDPIYEFNTSGESGYMILNPNITDNSNIILTDKSVNIMPTGTKYTSEQKSNHVKIYAKAQDYYNACMKLYKGGM